MDYTLKMERRDDYLYFYVTGRDSLEVSKAFWREMIEECIKLRYDKLLVDEDLEGSVSVVDAYEVVTYGADIPDIRNIRIALVERHSEHIPEALFGETVAANRGINAKVFKTVSEAEQWLLS